MGDDASANSRGRSTDLSGVWKRDEDGFVHHGSTDHQEDPRPPREEQGEWRTSPSFLSLLHGGPSTIDSPDLDDEASSGRALSQDAGVRHIWPMKKESPGLGLTTRAPEAVRRSKPRPRGLEASQECPQAPRSATSTLQTTRRAPRQPAFLSLQGTKSLVYPLPLFAGVHAAIALPTWPP